MNEAQLSALEEAQAVGQALAARALAPARARLVECLVKLTGAPERVCAEATYQSKVEDPLRWVVSQHFGAGRRTFEGAQGAAEAWELIAPEGWLDAQDRAFVQRDGSLSASPETVREALLLASDPTGVRTAESLAREVAARSAALGEPVSAVVAWRVVESRRFRAGFFAPVGSATAPKTRAEGLLFTLARSFAGGIATEARTDLCRAVQVATVKKLGGCGWDLATLVEYALRTRAAGRADPFGPLLELWHTGYALDALRPDAIVLAAPSFLR